MTNPLPFPDKPSDEAIESAKSMKNGWVYQIDNRYNLSPDDAVPPKAIMGAWQVDARGHIIGDFIKNPNYKGLEK